MAQAPTLDRRGNLLWASVTYFFANFILSILILSQCLCWYKGAFQFASTTNLIVRSSNKESCKVNEKRTLKVCHNVFAFGATVRNCHLCNIPHDKSLLNHSIKISINAKKPLMTTFMGHWQIFELKWIIVQEMYLLSFYSWYDPCPPSISFRLKNRKRHNIWTLINTFRINQHFGQVHPPPAIFNINIL